MLNNCKTTTKLGLGKLRKVKIENTKIVKISLVGEVGKSFPDLTKHETQDHVVDYKGHSISLLLVN